MKPLTILLSLSLLFSSCYSAKVLTKEQPITSDFLSKLEPGKQYKFELKTGVTQLVKITRVDADAIVGFISQKNSEGRREMVDYSASFENIEVFVANISLVEFSLGFTVLPIAMIATTMIMIIGFNDTYKRD